MDEKQLLYAVQIASSPDQSLRQQANDFLRDVLANADQYWTVSPLSLLAELLSVFPGLPIVEAVLSLCWVSWS